MTSIGAQSHLHHLLLDAMEKEHVPLLEQIEAARTACRIFPQLPDFYGRLGLLLAARGDAAALPELTRALERYESPADESGEASEFPAWAGAVSAARARLLMEMGDNAATEEEVSRALAFDTAREEALDVCVELHASEDAAKLLGALHEMLGEDQETCAYLMRFADSYGWLALAAAARAAFSSRTGRTASSPAIYEKARALAPEELGNQVVGSLAEYVREMPEILLRLERDRNAESPQLYHRLRELLPQSMRAFWRHYDEPDAVALPEGREGYDLVREAFIHHADAAQSERFLRISADYGVACLRSAAEGFVSAERWEGALIGWALLTAQEGETADSIYGMAFASLQLGLRAEAEKYLARVLVLDPMHRKSKELMELIQ